MEECNNDFKKMKNKFCLLLQPNKCFWIIPSVVFFLWQVLIVQNVFLMGDDYMYGTFAKEGIISSVSSYYYTGNGRWVLNVLDSFFIKIGGFLLLL